MQSGLVSILIPVYNRRNIIEFTINSALNQTYKNYEIIIVDNHSSDGTYEFLREEYSNREKVKLYQNAVNVGPVNNWKICLQYASGEYIKFLWSDDIIEKDFLEKTVNILKANRKIGLVYSNVNWTMYGKHKECTGIKLYIKRIVNLFFGHQIYKYSSYSIGKSAPYDRSKYLNGIFYKLYDVPVSASCALFRKKDVVIQDEIKNDFSVQLYNTGAGIDLLMFLNILSKYETFYFIDEILCYYGVHDGSFSVNRDLAIEYWIAKKYWLDITKKEENIPYYNGLINEILKVKKDEEAQIIIQRLFQEQKADDFKKYINYNKWEEKYNNYKKKQKYAMFWKINEDTAFIK